MMAATWQPTKEPLIESCFEGYRGDDFAVCVSYLECLTAENFTLQDELAKDFTGEKHSFLLGGIPVTHLHALGIFKEICAVADVEEESYHLAATTGEIRSQPSI
jgi:hypothetical protein